MTGLTLITYDWVPDAPRGFVRDLRVRWALEEAGLPYRVESTPFHDRGPEHFSHQPFGQVPWLIDGGVSIFESGAILLHLAERSDALMPAHPRGRSEVIQWVFAALNSIEVPSQPWTMFRFMGFQADGPESKFIDDWLTARLTRMEAALKGREWLVGSFSIADLLMADVLRVVDRFDGLEGYPECSAYLSRAIARPTFKKAHADQMAHFAAADRGAPEANN